MKNSSRKVFAFKEKTLKSQSERYAKIRKKHGFIPMPLGHYSYGLPLLVFIVVSLKNFE